VAKIIAVCIKNAVSDTVYKFLYPYVLTISQDKISNVRESLFQVLMGRNTPYEQILQSFYDAHEKFTTINTLNTFLLPIEDKPPISQLKFMCRFNKNEAITDGEEPMEDDSLKDMQ
jgi:hypothetical protein